MERGAVATVYRSRRAHSIASRIFVVNDFYYGAARALTPARTQVLHQFRFEYATGLNEQTAANRFVQDLHRFIIGILQSQPACDLLRCPFQLQFPGY
ncbi:hypothetical protein WJ62_03040 [Burkholderia diffusa]|nr:hypothetical protein WJ62_03040 [Burkholderia diffusa]